MCACVPMCLHKLNQIMICAYPLMRCVCEGKNCVGKDNNSCECTIFKWWSELAVHPSISTQTTIKPALSGMIV